MYGLYDRHEEEREGATTLNADQQRQVPQVNETPTTVPEKKSEEKQAPEQVHFEEQ